MAVHTEDHPLEYLEFQARSRRAATAPARWRIWDRGTYETQKLRDRKIEVAPSTASACDGRYALFPRSQGRADAKDWMIHRMDPPEDPAASRCPSRSSRCSRGSADLPPRRRALGLRDQVGRRARDRLLRARAACGCRRATATTSRGAIPSCTRLNRALSSHRAILDGEIVAFDDRRAAELRRAPAPHAPDRARRRRGGWPRSRPVAYVIFDLLWLDGHSLMGLPLRRAPARARGRSGSTGPRWQAPDHVVGDGARRAGRRARAGPRGHRRQAPGLPVRARPPLDALAKIKNVQREELVLRLAAGGGAATRPHRRAAGRPPSEDGRRCATPGGSAPASPSRSSTGSPGCSEPLEQPRASPFDRRARSRPAAPWVVEPRSSPRSSSSSGRRDGHAPRTRPTRACARTSPCRPSRPRRQGGARRRRSTGADASSSPTSTRSSIPRPASRSATSSTTTSRSRRCCCRTSRGRPLTLKRYPNGVDGRVLLREELAVAPARLGRGPRRCRWAARRSTSRSSPGRRRRSSGSANLADLELHTSLARADDLDAPDDAGLRPRPRAAGDDRSSAAGSRSGCRACSTGSG